LIGIRCWNLVRRCGTALPRCPRGATYIFKLPRWSDVNRYELYIMLQKWKRKGHIFCCMWKTSSSHTHTAVKLNVTPLPESLIYTLKSEVVSWPLDILNLLQTSMLLTSSIPVSTATLQRLIFLQLSNILRIQFRITKHVSSRTNKMLASFQ